MTFTTNIHTHRKENNRSVQVYLARLVGFWHFVLISDPKILKSQNILSDNKEPEMRMCYSKS